MFASAAYLQVLTLVWNRLLKDIDAYFKVFDLSSQNI